MVLHFWFSGLLKAKICLQDCRWSQGTCSFQGILSSGCYSMIPTHFKNWRKWCAYCKYITPLNNVSFLAVKKNSQKYLILNHTGYLFWSQNSTLFYLGLVCWLKFFVIHSSLTWYSCTWTIHFDWDHQNLGGKLLNNVCPQ